jgi:CDP-glycerol glycerophosphotransferase (TagB/SpsB family)
MKNLTQDKKDLILENSKIYNLLIASSKVDKISMEKAFAVDREKVVVTGLLRYEILKNNYKVDDQSLQNEINLIKSIKGTKKLVLYAPTFRELDYNILENLNLKLISEFTENNNFIFCIRLHPYSKQIHLDKIYKNVFFINNDICKETNILLKYTDLLVVDYSSIWIDFLLLNKPIIMYSPDITTYMTKERDLAYDINKIIDFNIYYDFNEFFKEMLFLLKNNEINYNHTKTIFHQYDLNFDFRLKFINTFKYKYQEFLK